MKKAALYIRVSTTHQIDKDSLPFQRKELINYSKYVLNIDDYVVFEDAGYSGKNIDRPAYKDMIRRIKQGEFSHLLVWKLDRISRNLMDFTTMYDELKKDGVTFISKNEQFDTSSAMGEAMLKIILVFAELERKLTSERVSAIMLSRAEKGLWNGANCPLGYKWDAEKKFPVPDESEKNVIRYIYSQYIHLESSTRVTSLLNENKIKTKRGGSWTTKTVSDIIRNPFYKGTYRYNYRESARGKIKNEDEWIIVDNNHEAIIANEEWQKANDIMDKNAERNSALFRANSHVHIFSGLLKCSKCNNGFNSKLDKARNDGFRPSLYQCQGKAYNLGCDAKIMGEVVLGPIVINLIANLLRAKQKLTKKSNLNDLEKILLNGKVFTDIKIDRASLERILVMILYTSTDNIFLKSKNSTKKILPFEVNNLKKEKEKNKRALERLEDLYLFSDESMSKKDYLLKKQKLDSTLKEIDIKLKELNKDNGNEDNDTFLQRASHFMISNELLSKKTVDYKKLITSMDKELIKEFINSLIKELYVTDGKVDMIHFKNDLVVNFI